MSSFGVDIALAVAQTFSITVPAHSAIVNDGEHVEFPVCTTIVNNGLLILQMPDGARFVEDAAERPTVVVDPVPATPGAAQIREAYEADTASSHQPLGIRVTYPTRKGVRTVVSLSLPMKGSSSLLSGAWVKSPRASDPADMHLEGETMSVTVEGDAPSVRYVRGAMVRGRDGRTVTGRWSVETPIITDGQPHATTAPMLIGGYRRHVRLEVTVPRP